MSPRSTLVGHSLANLALPLVLATFLFFALKYVTGSTYPILVIKSESMSPAFNRGDVVFLSNRTSDVQVGDIPALWFSSQAQPMIHRAIRTFTVGRDHPQCKASGPDEHCKLVVTKGDFNPVDDIALYPAGYVGARRFEVMGLAVGYLPWLGWPNLWLNEIWWAKYTVGGLALAAALMS